MFTFAMRNDLITLVAGRLCQLSISYRRFRKRTRIFILTICFYTPHQVSPRKLQLWVFALRVRLIHCFERLNFCKKINCSSRSWTHGYRCGESEWSFHHQITIDLRSDVFSVLLHSSRMFYESTCDLRVSYNHSVRCLYLKNEWCRPQFHSLQRIPSFGQHHNHVFTIKRSSSARRQERQWKLNLNQRRTSRESSQYNSSWWETRSRS